MSNERKDSEILRHAHGSAKYMFSVFNNIPVAMAVTSIAGGHFLDVNEEYQCMTEYSREELIGHTTIDLGLWYNPEERRQCIEMIRHERGKIQGLPVTLRTKSGKIRNILFSADFITLDGISCLISSAVDVSERQKAEDEIRRARKDWEEIFQAIGSPAVILDPQHTILAANHAVSAVSGMAAPDIIGRKCYEIFHGRGVAAPPAGCPMSRMLASGTVEPFSMELDAFGGVFLVSGTPIFDEKGNLEKIIHIATDITERKKTENALRKSEAKFAAAFHASAGLMAITRLADGEILEVNEGYSKMLGYSREESLGRTTMELAIWADLEDRAAFAAGLRLSGQIEDFETKLRRKDGSLITVIDNARTVIIEDEACVLSVAYDISERKRAEELVRLNEARLESLLRITQYRSESIQDLLDYALDEAIRLTGSRIGYIYFYDDDKKEFQLNTWSKDVMKECTVKEPQTVYELEKTGIWGEAVRQGRPIVLNDFRAPHPLKKGHPEGHAPLHRYLTIPVFSDGRIVAVAAVANKKEAYDESDVRQLTLLMKSVWRIVEQKQSEKVLRQAEENYRNFLDDSMLGVRIVSDDGETLYANQAILDIYGYDSLDELKTTPIYKRYVPGCLDAYRARKALRKKGNYGPSEYEVDIVRKNGEIRNLQVFRKPIVWSGESHYQVLYQDVTDRRRVTEALKESEQKYRDIYEKSVVGISRTTPDGRYLDMNQSSARMFGFDSPEEMKTAVTDIGTQLYVHPGDRERIKDQLAKDGMVKGYEVRRYRKDGSKFWVSITAQAIRDSDGNVLYYEAINEDITDRKRAEEEIRQTQKQMRALARRLQTIREEERTGIAREIHDELGGALTGLKIDFSLLTKEVGRIKDEEQKFSLLDRMYNSMKLIDKSIGTVRRIATELRPGILDDLGILAALEWQLSDFQKRTGKRCTWSSSVEKIALTEKQATALFRIFQETLTNVSRHADATAVNVQIHAGEDVCILEVEDNGKGIEVDKIDAQKSLGLLGMRERSQVFGGSIDFKGQPGRGTSVIVRIPLDKVKNKIGKRRKTSNDQNHYRR